MPYKRLEFAALCGLTPGNLSNYIKRRKVVVNDDDEIDGTLAGNKHFLEKRQAFMANKQLITNEEYEGGPVLVKKGKKNGAVIVPNPDPVDKIIKKDTMFNLDMDQKSLDIRKRQEEIELLELKKQKMQGLLIPTGLVRSVVMTQAESLKIAYNEASENLIIVLGSKKQFSTIEIADIRKELVKIINTAVDNSVDLAKRSIASIVKEYSELKGVGERE